MRDKYYFPVFIDLSKKHILVVGAGKIAARRVNTLADFAGRITVVAPEISSAIEELAGSEPYQEVLELVHRPYEPADLEGADLVIVATTDIPLNVEIGAACKQRGIPVNTSHDKSLCDFYFPGLVKKDNLVIGVTTSGTDHAKARRVTEMLREMMEHADFE